VEAQQGPSELSHEARLELLKYLTGLAEGEANRAWTRQSVLLSVNTALLGIAALMLSAGNVALVALPALLGLATTYVWQRLNQLGQFYQDRWYTDMDALIASDAELRDWVRGRAQPRVERPVQRRGADYFGFLPWVFLAWWIVLAVAAILGLFVDPIAQMLHAFGRQTGRP
jgi:hypothetical protein